MNGRTALTFASEEGHTEAIKALLTVPNIDINHATVRPCLLTSPHLGVVNGPRVY